jgi:hypothetical protein
MRVVLASRRRLHVHLLPLPAMSPDGDAVNVVAAKNLDGAHARSTWLAAFAVLIAVGPCFR